MLKIMMKEDKPCPVAAVGKYPLQGKNTAI